MHKIEDVSGNEAVRIPPMDRVCMDGIRTEYIKREPGDRHVKGKTICRIAAAGLTGLILTLYTAGAVYACSGSDCAAPQTAAYTRSRLSMQETWWGSDDKDQEKDEDTPGDGTSKGRQKTEWNEKEVLRRWNLDPDDFPEEEDRDETKIPGELIPYFEEAVSEAVTWYDGRTPQSDLKSSLQTCRKICGQRERQALKCMRHIFRECRKPFQCVACRCPAGRCLFERYRGK